MKRGKQAIGKGLQERSRKRRGGKREERGGWKCEVYGRRKGKRSEGEEKSNGEEEE